MTTSDIIAILALCISAYSIYKTLKFNKIQIDVQSIQNELNKLLLRRETIEALDNAKADLSANFIKLGQSSGYRLKIFNKGKTAARNVRIEFPDGNEILIPSDIESKFPLEAL